MSHFVAQSIVIAKDGTITVIGDDNNVYPKRNRAVFFNGDFRNLFDDLMSGVIQPVDSANHYKWTYAIMESRKGNTIDERFELFKKAYEFKASGLYILKRSLYDNDAYFVKKRSFGYRYSNDIIHAKKMGFHQAAVYAKKYGFEMVKFDAK